MRRINLIPMAGAGQRFVDAGITIPKPLIEADGVPMIERAAKSLPPADRWIFVCRAEHLADADLEDRLRELFGEVDIVPVEELTEGQACTCLLAKGLLLEDDQLTIGACDNAMTWEAADFDAAMAGTGDAWIWTFRNNPAVLQDPRMYGWVDVGAGGGTRAARVSVKVPISETPMNDHAVIGAFTFRRAGDFVRLAEDMIAANRRINNEFYVDELMNVFVESGKQVEVFEVDRYICWGTPADLALYDYWRGYFQSETDA